MLLASCTHQNKREYHLFWNIKKYALNEGKMWTPDALYRGGVCIAPAAAACLLLFRWPCCVCMLPGVIVQARACLVYMKCNAGGMQMCMGLRHARTHTQEGGRGIHIHIMSVYLASLSSAFAEL